MSLFSSIKTMDELFDHFLKDIYYAEKQILKSLPTMIEKAHNPQLKQALQNHKTETEGQVSRLERVFSILGKSPDTVTCEAINGIIKEAEHLLKDCDNSEVCDAAIAAAAQAVEHYEITRYGTLASWANTLNHHDAAALFAETLEEERNADKKLNQIAESSLNKMAA